MANPIRAIQLSDIHLFSDQDAELHGVKTEESFRAVIEQIKKRGEKADLLLLTGDLSQDGTESAYRRIAKELKPLDTPIYCIPGNHDNVQAMMQVYPSDAILNEHQIIFEKWQFILLDSKNPDTTYGHFKKSELQFLEKCLTDFPKKHAAILFHHHPLLIGSQWLDKLGIDNANEFWQRIAPYLQVKAIFFGHVHQENNKRCNEVHCYSCPSTCIQFKPKESQFTLDYIPQGYRWINLYEDGHIETGIERLPHYIGVFDQ